MLECHPLPNCMNHCTYDKDDDGTAVKGMTDCIMFRWSCTDVFSCFPAKGGFVLWILNGLRESFYKMPQQYKTWRSSSLSSWQGWWCVKAVDQWSWELHLWPVLAKTLLMCYCLKLQLLVLKKNHKPRSCVSLKLRPTNPSIPYQWRYQSY